MEPPKKIFLCWSKNRSKVIAEGWAKLLPEIVTGKPILSTEFQKGREWSTTLRDDLNDAKTGIIFLTPENVARAVATARPYAVDVNSGVEAEPGRKDPDKVWRFVAEAKGVR